MRSSWAPAHCSRVCSSTSATLPTKRGDAMFARLITLLALAVVVLVPAAQSAPSMAPNGLRAFLLRVDDFPGRTSFPRTPAFAWEPYDGAVSYDFQLATSRKMDDRTIVWSTDGRARPLRVPAVTIPVALPWMTGRPYALYIRVRAHTPTGVTRWSSPWGFNMQWTGDGKPEKLPDGPGLVRWTPVEGANSYQVWFEPQTPPGKLVMDDGERRGRTRLLPQRPGASPRLRHPVRQLEGARGQDTVRRDAERASGHFVRALERDLRIDALAGVGRMAHARPDRVGHPHRRHERTSSQPHARILVRRQHSHERRGRSALPRLRRDRPAMRERRIQRRRRRQPRLCTPGRDCRACRRRYPTGNGCGRRAGETDGGLRDVGDVRGLGTVRYFPGVAATTTGAGASTIPPEFAASGPSVDLWDLGRANARYWWTVVPVTTPVAAAARRPARAPARLPPPPVRHRQRHDDHHPVQHRQRHDDHLVHVPGPPVAAGRLRSRPSHAVCKDDGAGRDLGHARLRLRPVPTRRPRGRPDDAAVVLPCAGRRLGARAGSDCVRGAVEQDEGSLATCLENAAVHRGDVRPARGSRSREVVLPRPRNRPVHPRPDQADDLVAASAPEADEASVPDRARQRDHAARQALASNRASSRRRRSLTPPNARTASARRGAPTIRT